jgi:hypothetical protein
MMKKVIPFFLLILFAKNLFAQQPCNDDMSMNVKGKWVKTKDANMEGQTPQIISRIDKMQQLLQAAYPEPKGIEVKWHRSMKEYSLGAYFFTWYCNINEKKLSLSVENSDVFYIWINKLGWLAEKDNNLLVEDKPVYLLQKKVGELKGYSLFEGVKFGKWENTGIRYTCFIIITREGQSPYLPVTKKQYLKAYLNGIEKDMPKTLAIEENRAVRSDQQEEDDKKKHLEYIERSTRPDKVAKAKDLYLRSYTTDNQRREAVLNKLKKMFDKQMKPARELLAAITQEEGLQPAIVEGDHVSGFEKFSSDEKGGRRLVQLNPDYFNNKLPAYAPQFLVVYWMWDTQKPSLDFAKNIENNFNFKALQLMLDK